MNTPAAPVASDSATASSSRPQRLVRGLAWTGFGLGMAFVLGLGIAPALCGGGYVAPGVTVGSVIAFVVLMRWIKPGAWQRLGFGYAGLAVVLVYLAIDDSRVRRPQTMEEFAPAVAGDEKSYVVLMRYGKNHPLGKDFRFKPSDRLYRGKGVFMPKDPAWKTWLESNRAELETGWAQLDPVRNWWAELNTFDRIGDLTPTTMDAEIPAFGPIRSYAQHACAIASLQAIDGQGDAAVETLLPVLEVGYKLESTSRTLVRSMIAIVAQKMTLEAAEFVLNTTEVSPASRARLVAAIDIRRPGEAGARRLIGMEYTWAANLLFREKLGDILAAEFTGKQKFNEWPRQALNPLSPFVFNSRRTINLYGDLTAELSDLAARRELKELAQRTEEFCGSAGRAGFKNLGGSLVVAISVPAYSKVIESFWKTEDLRTALHTRLKA